MNPEEREEHKDMCPECDVQYDLKERLPIILPC